MTSRRITWAALLVTAALAAGCGQVTDERVGARDQVTKASCDYYQRCGQIGSGLMYADRESCDTQVRGLWDGAWPVGACQKIRQDQLNICVSAINGTQCNNVVNFFTTLGTCSQANVCAGGPDASVDQ